MKITKRQLRRIIKEAVSRKAIKTLSDAAINAVQNHSGALGGYGRRASSVKAREDKEYQVQWDTEYAFRVTIGDIHGQKEQWLVIVDSETKKADVVGRK